MFGRLSKRDRIILLIFVVAAIGYCFYHFLLVRQFQAYGQVKTDLAASQAKLTQSYALAASQQSESSKLDKAKKDMKESGKRFETEMRDGSSVIILGLDGIFEGVDITDLEPGEIKEDPYLLEMPMKIIAQGNYREMLSFCEDIENLTNLTEVMNLKMESVSESNKVNMTVNLIIFSAKTPQGRLSLEDVSRWLTGRYNIFRQPSTIIAPIPELTGKIIKPESPSDNTGSQPEGTGSAQGSASGSSDNSVSPQPEYIWKK